MKILCDRHQLTEVMGVAAGITPLKTPKPIAKNALLVGEDDSLTVFATDFEMSVRLRMESVKITEPGSVLLPARESHALLRELNEPTVTLESEESRCLLQGGRGSFVLVGDDPAQFPQQIQLQEGVSIEVPGPRFVQMFRQTGFAAAKEDSRYAINGVLLECRDGSLRLVATDGRRLALAYQQLEGDCPEVRMIVPLRALQALCRAIQEDATEPLKIVFSDNQAGFVVAGGDGRQDTLLVTQLLDRRFPDYEGVIPRVAETTIEMSRDLLEASLRRVAVLSAGDVRLVRFQFSSSSLEMSAENSGVGRGDVSMDVDVKGAGGSIGFNPDFVLEALKVAEQETIRLDMTDEETPAKFSLGEAFTYVLMPISAA
ncbi:MAG: DNA polymerase III subunit beta [Planctomycetota bacterium]